MASSTTTTMIENYTVCTEQQGRPFRILLASKGTWLRGKVVHWKHHFGNGYVCYSFSSFRFVNSIQLTQPWMTRYKYYKEKS